MPQRMDRLRTSANNGDGGFTLIELLVVMVILAGCLLGLMTVQVSALRSVTVAKERQQATALTNRTMEQLRALPYDTVTAGLNTSDLAGDANIAAARLKPVGYPNTIDEHLVSGGSAAALPLLPHCQQTADTLVRAVQYKVCTYVTLVSPTAGDTSKGYWLTVITTWSSGATQGRTITVSTRSQVFSPSGCLSTATRPFSGPCQAFHDGTAGSQPAGISVAGAVEGARLIPGNALLGGQVDLPQVTASVQSQQVVSVQAVAQTSGARYADDTPSAPTTGSRPASTGAFTDPDATSTAVPTSATVSQSSAALLRSGASGSFDFTSGANDSGGSVSTTNATSAGNCSDLAGTAVTSGQACGSSRMTHPTGAQTVSLTYGQTLPLGSVAAPAGSVTDRAFVARYLAPGGSYCPTTSGAGCLSAGVGRSVGTSTLGGLPATLTSKTPGFGSTMVSITGYADGARAAAGIGSEASTATRSGTLTYWTGSSYAPVPLGPLTSETYPLGTASGSYATVDGPVTVTMTGQVTLGPGGPAAPTGPATCQPTPCVQSSSSGTLTASVDYVLSRESAVFGRFTATLKLGSSLARATYRAPLQG